MGTSVGWRSETSPQNKSVLSTTEIEAMVKRGDKRGAPLSILTATVETQSGLDGIDSASALTTTPNAPSPKVSPRIKLSFSISHSLSNGRSKSSRQTEIMNKE